MNNVRLHTKIKEMAAAGRCRHRKVNMPSTESAAASGIYQNRLGNKN